MGRIAVTLAVALLVLLVLAPVATMVLASFRTDAIELTDGELLRCRIKNSTDRSVTVLLHGESDTQEFERGEVAWEGRVWTLQNYRGLLSGRAELQMLVATLALAGASALIAFLIGLPVGLLFGATNFPGRTLFETLSVLPLVLPPILLAIASYYDLLGVEPAFLRAVIVFGLCLWPLVSLFTARAVRATGAEAIDAARISATPMEALTRVILRPALPGAAAGALLAFVFVVSDFAVPDFLGVTTAQNTITVYANAVFRFWATTERDVGAATAVGMPATLLAGIAFALVMWVEARRSGAQTVGAAYREINPIPLGRWRWPALLLVCLLLLLSLAWPLLRHAESAAGKHFGQPVAMTGATTQVMEDSRARPDSVWDGMRRGLQHDGVGEAVSNSLMLAGGGALLAVLLALMLTEAGRGRPRLDRFLLIGSFLPVAVPPMAFAVGWVTFFGPSFSERLHTPILLMAARLLPFATFAVRAARLRLADEMLEAGAIAGLSPIRRMARITLPLVGPGAALGFLLAFLFGLREVDAIIFTRQGGMTLPVKLYSMIHYGYDVQVAGLSILWTVGIGLFLGAIGLLVGRRFRVMP